MRKMGPIIALLLAWQLVPGSGEILESAVHLVSDGHTAHALPDAEHQSGDAEHGCSGPFHLCACHVSTTFLTAVVAGSVGASSWQQTHAVWCVDDSRCDGHSLSVFRPPIA